MDHIPCVLMRGGSSKGLFFLAENLPEDPAARDRLLLAAMGSPDLRQIDGMGGGNDLSSKVVIVAPSRRPDADVEYLFAQVSVARDLVDVLPNSGNMLAAVGPFALERGLVKASSPATRVRILNINSGKLVEAIVQTPGAQVTYSGTFHLDGVPGTSAPITLNFLDPAGTKTGRLLPTGNAQDVVAGMPVTCIDFAIPIVFVKAASLGKSGHESKQELDGDAVFLARLEEIRVAAAERMGLAVSPDRGVPKIAMIASPRHGGSIVSRYFVPSSCHPVHAATGALALAAACHTPDTVAEELAEIDENAPRRIVIEHPSGQMSCELRLAAHSDGGVPVIDAASLVTSARPLLSGEVFVRPAA
ncbi:MAG TPA: 4-oxalomesaconate tautomerase [Aromatoleum sp.]|uniref:4-oxalomesaconate tautomerase n=1 Tax=Aromatoleum sp. TaxID=2307007 RepID=UPI002B460D83|nr:4-oxalomesaconate tautomerase [Aromatoleum sp.]HJV28755.1 4-oxalomesaconate tautomerase [Aromatoleum sp.]